MQIFGFIIRIASEGFNISNTEILSEFKNYCEPIYKNIDIKMKLKKLLVIFRHGDRSPLSAQNIAWSKKNCIECSDTYCEEKPCKDGLLTKKGFKQAFSLGKFIKEAYLKKLNVKVIRASHTKINRTLSTLHGVIKGSKITKYNLSIDPSLVSDSQCANLKEKLLNIKGTVSKKGRNAYNEYKMMDNYMASICSGVPIDCKSMNCDIKVIYDFLMSQKLDYEELSNTYFENQSANAVSFYTLAESIKKRIEDKYPVHLISAHDSTLARLLYGLKIHEKELPPYASAIFIEILEDMKQVEYVRIIYQGRQRKFALYGEEFVEKSEFLNYLNMFSSKAEDLEKICNAHNGNKAENIIKENENILNILNQSNLVHQIRNYNKPHNFGSNRMLSSVLSLLSNVKLTISENVKKKSTDLNSFLVESNETKKDKEAKVQKQNNTKKPSKNSYEKVNEQQENNRSSKKDNKNDKGNLNKKKKTKKNSGKKSSDETDEENDSKTHKIEKTPESSCKCKSCKINCEESNTPNSCNCEKKHSQCIKTCHQPSRNLKLNSTCSSSKQKEEDNCNEPENCISKTRKTDNPCEAHNKRSSCQSCEEDTPSCTKCEAINLCDKEKKPCEAIKKTAFANEPSKCLKFSNSCNEGKSVKCINEEMKESMTRPSSLEFQKMPCSCSEYNPQNPIPGVYIQS